MFALIILLMVVGLIAVSSASAVLSFERFGHNNYYLFRQLIFVGIGLGGMILVSKVDFPVWERFATPIFLGSLLLLALVLIPGISFQKGQTRSWFVLGPFLLQPAEFFKLAVVIYLSAWFAKKKDAEQNFWFGLVPPLLAVGSGLGLIMLQPDLGTALMIAITSGAIMFAVGTPLRYLVSFGTAAVAGVWLAVKAAPYRAARIITFLDPSLDPLGIGYHINQALLAIGSGGFWGYGLGESRQKHNYLPEAIGDSIFAVMAEELGFLRISMVILLFAAFGLVGFWIAKQAPDRFSKAMAVGITSWIIFQALINIAAISGSAPLTGITLPFISYGGSSMLALALACGILLNISKRRV